MAEETKTREERPTIKPLVLVCRDADSVLLKLEMPGVPKDGIEVTVDGDTLSIRGHRPQLPEAARYVVRERPHGDYAHTFTIDETIDRENIEATMEHGILTVRLHLREEQKPRKITVNT